MKSEAGKSSRVCSRYTNDFPTAALWEVLSRMQNNFFNKRLAHLLGYGGLIPFVSLCVASWCVHPDWLGSFIRGQLAYAVAIMSFLGGTHWGVALTKSLPPKQTKLALLWSVALSLIAWFATMAGGFGFAILMAGFIAAYQVDKRLFAWYDMPVWFLRLRLQLTCVVVASLIATVMAANVRG